MKRYKKKKEDKSYIDQLQVFVPTFQLITCRSTWVVLGRYPVTSLFNAIYPSPTIYSVEMVFCRVSLFDQT